MRGGWRNRGKEEDSSFRALPSHVHSEKGRGREGRKMEGRKHRREEGRGMLQMLAVTAFDSTSLQRTVGTSLFLLE